MTSSASPAASNWLSTPSRARTSVAPWEDRKSEVPQKTHVFFIFNAKKPPPPGIFGVSDSAHFPTKQPESKAPPITQHDVWGARESPSLPAAPGKNYTWPTISL